MNEIANIESPAPVEPTADKLLSALSVKRRRFVVSYVELGNAKRAAELAGYSPKTAHAIGRQLIRQHAIRRAIDALMRENGPDPADLIADLQRIIAFDPSEFGDCYRQEDGKRVVDWDKIKARGLGAYIREIGHHGRTGDQSIRHYSRTEAIALAAKLMGIGGPETAVQVNVSTLSVAELQAIVSGR